MIVMLSTSAAGILPKQGEIGLPCDQLLTPATGNALAPDGMFAVDNSCFTEFDRPAFERLLINKVRPNRSRCRWVSSPDIVGNARRTLELFHYWHPRIARYGVPVALVLQNGIENCDIPWRLVGALFIGGDDNFKGSRAVRDAIKCGRMMRSDLWVHMGRVNQPERRDMAESMGCDSLDGTSLVIFPDKRKRFNNDPNGMFGDEANPIEAPDNRPVPVAVGGRGVEIDEGSANAGESGKEHAAIVVVVGAGAGNDAGT